MLRRPDHTAIHADDPFEITNGVVFDDHVVEDLCQAPSLVHTCGAQAIADTNFNGLQDTA
jgi:hypothetical protein